MTWKVEGYVRLGPIGIGVAREELHGLLVGGSVAFERVPDSGTPTDEEYPDSGVFVYYDDYGRVELVEGYAADGDSAPEFRSLVFNGRPVDEVLAELESMGITPDIDDGALRAFSDYGFAIFSSDILVESTSVCRRGYYDE